MEKIMKTVRKLYKQNINKKQQKKIKRSKKYYK